MAVEPNALGCGRLCTMHAHLLTFTRMLNRAHTCKTTKQQKIFQMEILYDVSEHQRGLCQGSEGIVIITIDERHKVQKYGRSLSRLLFSSPENPLGFAGLLVKDKLYFPSL